MRPLARAILALALAAAARAGADDAPATAPADPVRVAVVPLDAPPELAFVARSLAAAVAAEAGQAEGLAVLGPDAVAAALGRDAAAALSGCGDDAPCLAERGQPLAADRVVAGWLGRAGDAYRIALVLVDLRTGARLAALERDVPVASRRLHQDVAAAAPALLAGRGDPTGLLVVAPAVDGAAVAIDGRRVGTTPLTRAVKPGRHEVRVSKPGHVEAEPAWVEVPAGETVTHRPRLFVIPGRERKNGRDRTDELD